MSDKSTIDAYNKIALEYSSRNNAPFYAEQYNLFRSFIKSGNNIIEIGCGTGRDAEELVKLGFDYTGVDASENMLSIAEKRVPEAKFQVGDFYRLDFPDHTFDGFWAAASFLHVPKKDISIVLSEAKRISKPEGVGFISLKEKTQLDEGYIKETKAGGIERYFAFYENEEFKKILEANKFEVLSETKKIEHDGTTWLCFIVKSL